MGIVRNSVNLGLPVPEPEVFLFRHKAHVAAPGSEASGLGIGPESRFGLGTTEETAMEAQKGEEQVKVGQLGH